MLMPKPTFSEYAFSCHLRGCRVVEVPLISNKGQRIDLDSMRRQLPGTKAAYICNPNNPSGSILSREAVMEFAEECARHGTILFLDETLLELVQGWEGITCLPEVDRLDNLFIIRSLTKCFAIPGIRIGYGVGSAPLISSLEGSRLSWNLGQIEIAVGSNLLRNDYAYIQRAAEMMAKEKVQLTHRLVDIGLVRPTLPDSFFFFSPCVRTGAWLQEQLLHHKVLIRDCSSFGAPYSSYVRFAVKRPEQNDRLIAAMEAVAKKVP